MNFTCTSVYRNEDKSVSAQVYIGGGGGGAALKFFEKINDKWHYLTYAFKKVKPVSGNHTNNS